MIVKWNNKIILINEYLVNKTCKLFIDRDINTIINIFYYMLHLI